MFYESYLNSIKPDESYIPESASFKDMHIFMDRSLQDIYNETFINIAMQEMASFEANVIREADEEAKPAASAEQKKSLLKRIGDFFKGLWEKIKGFFVGLIRKIKEMFQKFKVEKGKVILTDYRRAVKILYAHNDTKFEKEGPDLSAMAEIKQKANNAIGIILKDNNDAAKKFMDNKNISENTYNKDSLVQKLGFRSFNDIDTKESEAVLSKGKFVTYKVIDLYSGQKGTKESDLFDLVLTGKSTIEVVEKFYKATKQTIDKNMNDAKNIVNKNKTENLSYFLKYSKDCISVASKVCSVYTGIMKRLHSSAVSLVSAVIVASKSSKSKNGEKKEEGKEAKNESARFDELEEAFYSFHEEDETPAPADDSESSDTEVDVEVNDDDVPVDSDEDGLDEAAATDLYNALVSFLD